MRFYEKVHLVVAIPGRILDMMGKKVANVENCKILCLNEADKEFQFPEVNVPNVFENYVATGITKAVDITLDVIEDVLAQIPTIPPVQIQIAKLPTKSELFL